MREIVLSHCGSPNKPDRAQRRLDLLASAIAMHRRAALAIAAATFILLLVYLWARQSRNNKMRSMFLVWLSVWLLGVLLFSDMAVVAYASGPAEDLTPSASELGYFNVLPTNGQGAR